MACRDLRIGVLPQVPSQSSDDSLGPNGKVECPLFPKILLYIDLVLSVASDFCDLYMTIIALVLLYLFV